MLFQTTAILTLAASASAHIIMQTPAPFAWEDAGTKQSPLAPSDFPCKQPAGTYAVTSMNTVAAGGSLNVKLVGGATHGGGSCQFSITTDTKPTNDSQWKVIHSQIGGCLADTGKNPAGQDAATNNWSNDAEDPGNPEIPVKIPEGLPAGQYTFAWSWINKLGNREFYMNCAPLEVTAGSSKRDEAASSVESVLGQLPDMFVANLPLEKPNQCNTTEGEVFVYPNPGNDVAMASGAATGTALTGGGCAAMTILGAGAGKLGSPAEATAAPSNGGGIFAPGASSAASSAPAVTQTPAASQPAASAPVVTQAPVASAPVASAPVASAPAASYPAAQPSSAPSAPNSGSETGTGANTGSGSTNTGSGSTNTTGDCTPCTNDGAVVCIGTDSFGLCNFGCAVAQKLAAGMTCSSGTVARRSIRFPRGTLHQRHASLHKRRSVM